MASCEKCWSDAYVRSIENPMKTQTEHYQDLLKERIEYRCTPEQQAGISADFCPKCKRNTLHQHTKRCVICSYFPFLKSHLAV